MLIGAGRDACSQMIFNVTLTFNNSAGQRIGWDQLEEMYFDSADWVTFIAHVFLCEV